MKIKAVVKIADGCCCRGCQFLNFDGNDFKCELFETVLPKVNPEMHFGLSYKCRQCLKSEADR